MQILPAIDIFGGKCVRLTEGSFASQKVYSDDPCFVAKQFAEAGALKIHVVDLDGAKTGAMKNISTIERLLSLRLVEVQVGGGVRSFESLRRLLNSGVSSVVIGSVAIRSPETFAGWVRQFGAEHFVVALDFRDSQLAFNGWQQSDRTQTRDIVDSMSKIGINSFLSTDIRRDGTMTGPNIQLYERLVKEFSSARWMASGGVGSLDDIETLRRTGVAAVIIGKALYEGRLPLNILKESH